MSWSEKLPTWRGITNFFYIAANWRHISEDFAAYRRQIRDREEWAQRALAEQAHLHALTQERLRAEVRQAEAAYWSERAQVRERLRVRLLEVRRDSEAMLAQIRANLDEVQTRLNRPRPKELE